MAKTLLVSPRGLHTSKWLFLRGLSCLAHWNINPSKDKGPSYASRHPVTCIATYLTNTLCPVSDRQGSMHHALQGLCAMKSSSVFHREGNRLRGSGLGRVGRGCCSQHAHAGATLCRLLHEWSLLALFSAKPGQLCPGAPGEKG